MKNIKNCTVPILFILIGMVWVCFIVFIAFPAAKKYAPEQTYEAVVTVVACEEVIVVRFGELQSAYNITSVYSVNGVEYKKYEKETLAPKEIGDSYILYVDPNNPYSYTTTKNPYEVLYGTIFGLFFILMGGIGLFSITKKNSNEKK